MNRIVISCNTIVKPEKLGSYTTKSVRDMRKVSLPLLKNVCIKSSKLMQCRFETKIINKMHWNQFPVMGVLVA